MQLSCETEFYYLYLMYAAVYFCLRLSAKANTEAGWKAFHLVKVEAPEVVQKLAQWRAT